jgi:hypothetical protein
MNGTSRRGEVTSVARAIPAARWLRRCDATGSRTQAAGLFAAGVVATVLFFPAPVMALLPIGACGSARARVMYVERAAADLGRDVDWRRLDEPPRPSGGAP